jgi:PKD repeat protein
MSEGGDANNSGSILQNPSTIYYENGVFVVTQIVRDDYGCTDTARVAIKINNITNETVCCKKFTTVLNIDFQLVQFK